MDNVEEEFFKAFKYEPEYKILIGRRKIDDVLVCEYFKNLADAEQFLQDEFEEGLGARNIEEIYPTITPEIVLKLEEIFLDKYIDSLLLTKIKDRTFEYRIGYSNYWNNIVQAYTRKDALLKLCIQLKDEIQDQVKDLFNGK